MLPAAGIRKYLGSALIKGIGPVIAERMVARFGVDIMHVIKDEPGRLTVVDGLGPKRTAMIAAAWAGQKGDQGGDDLPAGRRGALSLAVRIYKKYGNASVPVVRHCYLAAPNLIADAAKILDVPAALAPVPGRAGRGREGGLRDGTRFGLARAGPGRAAGSRRLPAAFQQAERSLAHALLRPRAVRPDRLNAFAAVDWDKALGFRDHH